VADSQFSPELSPPDPPSWARVTKEQFAQVVAGLPADCRVVFELHVVLRTSYDAIAARLGIPRVVVEARLHQARSLLKKSLIATLGDQEKTGW
jgi:RNA polymerase sigma factor (sigma-70 family)